MSPKIKKRNYQIKSNNINVILCGFDSLKLHILNDSLETVDIKIGDSNGQKHVPDGDLFRKEVKNVP